MNLNRLNPLIRHGLERFLTKKQLAQKLNVSYSMVMMWKSNRNFPTEATILRAAELFNINPLDLYSECERFKAEAKNEYR